MSKSLNTNFHIKAPAPIDARMQVSTYTGLDAIPIKFNHMVSHVIDEDADYRYYSSTNTWVELVYNGSTVWGTLIGSITSQSDLMAYFDLYALAGHTHTQLPPLAHTHEEIDITDLDKYTQVEVDALVDYKVSCSTGLINGGTLSINADTTKFDLTEGLGIKKIWASSKPYIPPVTYLVDFAEALAITPTYLATDSATYIGISYDEGLDTYSIVQSSSPFSASNRRDIILIGIVEHIDNVNINAVHNWYIPAIPTADSFNDLSYNIGNFVISGNVYTPKGANLNLVRSSGSIAGLGLGTTNTTDTTLESTVTFNYALRDDILASTTDVDPDYYDVAGVLTAVTASYWSIQKVYVCIDGSTHIQYGQTEYETLAEATKDLDDPTYIVEPYTSSIGILRAHIIVQQGCSALNDSEAAVIVRVGKFGNTITPFAQMGIGITNTSQLINDGEGGAPFALITDIYKPTQIIDVDYYWLQDYTYKIVRVKWVEAGELFEVIFNQNAVLGTADGTFDRIDTAILTLSSDLVSILPGTATAQPSPEELTEDQLALFTVLVETGTTQPSTVFNTLVFDENVQEVGGEFDTSTTVPARISFESIADPSTNIKHIFWNNCSTGDLMDFTYSSLFITGNYDKLIISIKCVNTANHRVRVSLRNGVVSLGSIEIFQGTYGFDKNNVSTYQDIIIPITDLDPFGVNSFDSIRIENRRNGASLYIDNIKLQSGTSVVNPGGSVNFIDLLDTPAVYTGSEGYNVRVNAFGIGLEFVTPVVSNIPPIENDYPDMPTMYADQVSQTNGFIQYVADASAHPDFGVVEWYFEYLGTVVGNETDYRPLTVQEVAAIQLQADWNQTNIASADYIKNKPTNTSAFTNDGADSTSTYVEFDELPLLPTSTFINDGETGVSRYVEVVDLDAINYSTLAIGGVAGTINTPALLAAKFTFIEAQVVAFTIVGNDIYATINNANYEFVANAFLNNGSITFIRETTSIITATVTSNFALKNASNLVEVSLTKLQSIVATDFLNYNISLNADNVNLPELRTITGNFTFRDNTGGGTLHLPKLLSIDSSQAIRFTNWNVDFPELTSILNTVFYDYDGTSIYMPKCTQLGATVNAAGNADNVLYLVTIGATITVNYVLETANAGNPDTDLVYAVNTRSANIIYAGKPRTLVIDDDTPTTQFSVDLDTESLQFKGFLFDPGNKRITVSQLPAPNLRELVPETYLPSTTGNFILRGSYFTEDMIITIEGHSWNYWTFVDSNEVLVNLTTSATEGFYDVTLNNGIEATFANALQIVNGTVYQPSCVMSSWTNLTGSINVCDEVGAAKLNVYYSIGTARWTLPFDRTKDFAIEWNQAKSPFSTTEGLDVNAGIEDVMRLYKTSDNSTIWYLVNYRNDYLTAWQFDSGSARYALNSQPRYYTHSIKYIGGIWYFYYNNVLKYTGTASINNVDSDMYLRVTVKGQDIRNLKYIDLTDTGGATVDYSKLISQWINDVPYLVEADLTAFSENINQVAHTFAVGDGIRNNGTIFVKALADLPNTSDITGIVTVVTDADNFTVQYGGIMTTGTWTLGEKYFLSNVTAGLVTNSVLTYAVGEVRQFVGTGVPTGLLIEIDLGDEIVEADPTAVTENLFDAQSVLLSIADNSPFAQVVANSRLIGRKATGDIGVLTPTEVIEMLGLLPLYVPYIGATGNVDIGVNRITAQQFRATGTAPHIILDNTTAGSSTTDSVSIMGGANELKINVNVAGTNRNIFHDYSLLSTFRRYYYPDTDGTIALTSDITGSSLQDIHDGTSGTNNTANQLYAESPNGFSNVQENLIDNASSFWRYYENSVASDYSQMNLEVDSISIEAGNYSGGNQYARFEALPTGEFIIRRNDIGGGQTIINSVLPTAITTLQFPAKTAGTYTIATTSDFSYDALVENAAVTGSYNLDYNNDTWYLTLTGATTLTETNLPPAGKTKVITLHVTGNQALTYPAGWSNLIEGAYDASAELFASGVVTCATVLAGDTVTVNGLLYTAVAGVKADNTQFSVDTSNTACATDLAASITADVRAGTLNDVTATSSLGVVTILQTVVGIGGNATTLISSNGTRLAVSGATFTGGDYAPHNTIITEYIKTGIYKVQITRPE